MIVEELEIMLQGNINQFSLPEIFRMIEDGNQSGLLSLATDEKEKHNSIEKLNQKKHYYIWFKQGKIVAAANRLDCNGLLSLMSRRSWIKDKELSNFCSDFKNLTIPLGLFLQNQGILESQDLQMLFKVQVLREILPLFQLKSAQFKLYKNVSAPMIELTGITIKVSELLLQSLRALPNWKALRKKLPYRHSILSRSIEKPLIPLNTEEKKVWEIAKNNLPISKIAQKLSLEVQKVQQIAFRLIVVGFAEEIPVILASSSRSKLPIQVMDLENSQTSTSNTSKNLSTSYFHNLANFFGDGQTVDKTSELNVA